MRQETLADEGFEKYRKPTRRERFLDEMNRLIPWADLAAVLEPFYPRGEGRGRPPIGVERLRRIPFLPHGFNLSDPAVEEALDDSGSCAASSGSTSGGSPCRTRPPSASSAICWSVISWERGSLLSSGNISRRTVSRFPPGPLWTPRSSARRVPPRIRTGGGIPRCIRRERAISGSLG